MKENSDKKSQALFGTIFLLAQRWQTMGDRYLAAENITAKQWLLLASIEHLGGKPATLNEITRAFGTSRQNVKQLALGLEKRGFLNISQDDQDKRALRFEITSQNRNFWQKRAQADQKYISDLFKGIQAKDLEITLKTMQVLLINTQK
ncbi:MAG: MarR family transcriptional regulator [Candidatus Marinimicrobia bacterium]|nr:MarR family transcriptional regulator [Candidatus Neomarinimicrobiota bacterium]MCF7904172.1 MarR family transcriptional regulator [Candidatus Neomarinimicrobiota bacterium]